MDSMSSSSGFVEDSERLEVIARALHAWFVAGVLDYELFRPLPGEIQRPIVIDGPNVAYAASGRRGCAKFGGLLTAMRYFVARGFDVETFVQEKYKRKMNGGQHFDTDIVWHLESLHLLTATPFINYDDLYMLQRASNTGGCLITNDQFKDIQKDYPEKWLQWQSMITERRLQHRSIAIPMTKRFVRFNGDRFIDVLFRLDERYSSPPSGVEKLLPYARRALFCVPGDEGYAAALATRRLRTDEERTRLLQQLDMIADQLEDDTLGVMREGDVFTASQRSHELDLDDPVPLDDDNSLLDLLPETVMQVLCGTSKEEFEQGMAVDEAAAAARAEKFQLRPITEFFADYSSAVVDSVGTSPSPVAELSQSKTMEKKASWCSSSMKDSVRNSTEASSSRDFISFRNERRPHSTSRFVPTRSDPVLSNMGSTKCQTYTTEQRRTLVPQAAGDASHSSAFNRRGEPVSPLSSSSTTASWGPSSLDGLIPRTVTPNVSEQRLNSADQEAEIFAQLSDIFGDQAARTAMRNCHSRELERLADYCISMLSW